MPETHINPVERAAELREQLTALNDLYYNTGESPVSDADFDALLDELRALESEQPSLITSDSPTQTVGSAPVNTDFETVAHERRMYSLDKTKTMEGVTKFLDTFAGQFIIVQPKFDGGSVSLIYREGRLERAVTRGDGNEGLDVTVNVLDGIKRGYITGIPERLGDGYLLFDAAVRGEIVMRRSAMAEYNATRPSNARPLKHERNAAVGALLKKDRTDAPRRPLHFIAFEVAGVGDMQTPVAFINLGFEAGGAVLSNNRDELLAAVGSIAASRPDLDVLIDGVVLRVADNATYEAAGFTSQYPKGALALKLPEPTAVTTLRDVDWTVGRTGKLVPRAILEPVDLDGRTMQHASLANLAEVGRRGIRLGISVNVHFAQAIIPQVIGPAEGVTDEDGEEIEPPATCPSCGHDTILVGNSDQVYCGNRVDCPGQRLRQLTHWASRAAADIDGLSSRRIEQLVAANLIARVSDLYALTYDDLMPGGVPAFEGLAAKSATKIIEAISASKDIGLRRALIGFSIPIASEGTAERLCRDGFEDIEAIALLGQRLLDRAIEDGSVSVDDFTNSVTLDGVQMTYGGAERKLAIARLCEVDDIGQAVASSLVNALTDLGMIAELARLKGLGVNLAVRDEDRPVVLDDAQVAGSLVAGRKHVVTGAMEVSGLTRSQIEAAIKAAGGTTSGSVSKNTDVLVVGPGAGSKLTKGQSLVEQGHPLEIIDEAEIVRRLGL